MDTVVIKVSGLSRNYCTKKGIFKKTVTTKKAVQEISFKVHKGEIFGLLGPNGAGKTTTMKVLTTLLMPDAGSVEIFGLDIEKDKREIRKRINFIYGGERSLYTRLSARDNLAYFCDLYEVDERLMKVHVEGLLKSVGLENCMDQKVETFSKGMTQRLQIARALINDPEIIFMDEPTLGLDPAAAKLLHDKIIRMKDEGKTVILTTHYMKEAENLCDRIALINEGKIVDVDTPEQLKVSVKNHFGIEANDLEEVYLAYFGEKRSVS